jgi:hypothetical protein
MKEILLTHGMVVQVDDEDYEWLNQWKWFYAPSINKSNKTGYARRFFKVDKKMKSVFIHREIMKTPADMETDHIDHDGLNNQRSNLRICTHSENQRNRLISVGINKSGYKGVCWNKTNNKWRSSIKINDQRIVLGDVSDPEEAARRYNEAAQKLFGEFARLNIVPK